MRRASSLVLLLAACAAPPAAPPEKPKALDVVINGQQTVAETELRAAARRELRAYADHGEREADAADAAYAMEMVLRDEGFSEGRVSFETQPGRLRFTVEEGPRASLQGVIFEGVSAVPEDSLRRFFDFPGSGALGSGLPYFRLRDLEAAIGKVEHFYLLDGFLRVRVAEPRVEWNADRTLAQVTVAVEEGSRYLVEEVEFEGLDPVDLDLVGQPYHARLPVEAAAAIQGRLRAEGRQFARVDAEAVVDDARAAVRLVFRGEPGEVVRLRKVEIEGNRQTRRWFLRRRIPIQESEIVLQRLLDGSVDNLYRTGLFSAVRPRLEQVDERTADLRVGVEEVEPRSVDFELGYGSYELARGAVRYRNRNLFGLGRRFGLEGRASVKSFGADLDFEDPYLLGERTTLGFSTGYLLREEPSFDLQSYKFDLIFTRHPRDWLRLRFGYRFRIEEATNVTGDISEAEEEGFTRTAGLFAGIRSDTRDSLVIPGRGAIWEAALLWSAPELGARLHFLEIDLRYARYFSVGEDTVFAVGGRFTTREILDGRSTLPIQERLFLGGSTSVRSFEESELGPFNAAGEPVGGLTAAEAHFELRRRVWKALSVALFYDIGMVASRSLAIEGPPGHALGVGLRYLLPVGPARLDFGYNPAERFAADRSWALHLAFGFSF